jgi:preprotein translocase subunit YajC
MPLEQAGGPLGSFFPLIAIFLIFYFIVIRPERAKQKEHKNQLSKLGKNDQVVTSGGIHGTVVNVKPDTIVLRVDDNVRIEVDKEAVTKIKSKAEN